MDKMRRTTLCFRDVNNSDKYCHDVDVFILDGEIVRTPGRAMAICQARHGMHPIEARMHLSALVRNGVTVAGKA